jgi:hypothetical protein
MLFAGVLLVKVYLNLDSITKAIIDTVRCVGGDLGIVYVTVPITSGFREIRLMHELGCSRQELRSGHSDRWRTEVVQPNEADAEAFALVAKMQYPNRLVLNPAALQVSEWSQAQYNDMWNEVLRQFCDVLVVTPDWAFSVGARLEVKEMSALGRSVVDMFGRQVTSSELMSQMESANNQLLEMGWTEEKIAELLPPIGIRPEVRMSRSIPHAEWNAALEWIIAERRWQRSIPEFADDDRTLRDGSDCRGGEWQTLLDKYLGRARAAGINSTEGGLNLMKFVSAAVAFMESVTRVYGPFPEPGVSRGTPIREGRLWDGEMSNAQLMAVSLAWLRREYFYTRNRFDPRDDDENTEAGISDGSWWDRQLKFYWNGGGERRLDTAAGRQMLGKFVSTAMNLASSRIRLFGMVGQPNRPSYEELARRRGPGSLF